MSRWLRSRPTLAVVAGLAVGGLLLTASPATASPAAPAASSGLDSAVAAALSHRDRGDAWLDAATIPELQAKMDAGELSSVRLTLMYLNRIHRLDDDLNAVLAVNRLALRDAFRSDLQRRRHGARSALEGIPVLLKDNIDTRAQGATAGSNALLDSTPDDATLVRKLTEAGAVVIGKANLTEWANFRASNMESGWSAVGGQTGNAYVTDRNPCGSSAGSAAGVAASFAQVAIGTETNGSIVCPAGANGVVGIKPSVGVVSRAGVVPISAEQDTAGPMARHLVDAAITLGVLQGGPSGTDVVDPADPATADVPADQTTDYAAGLDADSLAGARVGVWRFETGSPESDAVTDASVAALEAAGATVVDVLLPYQDTIGNDSFVALKAEFKRDLNAYLAETPGDHPMTLAELITFNENDPVELSLYDQQLFIDSQASPDASSPEIQAARDSARSAARAAIDETLATYDLDAIMAPTNSPAWTNDPADGDGFVFGSSGTAAVAGYPNVTVPAGYSGDLPVGMSFFAGHWGEADMLSLAYSFEQHTQARRVPQLLPTTTD